MRENLSSIGRGNRSGVGRGAGVLQGAVDDVLLGLFVVLAADLAVGKGLGNAQLLAHFGNQGHQAQSAGLRGESGQTQPCGDLCHLLCGIAVAILIQLGVEVHNVGQNHGICTAVGDMEVCAQTMSDTVVDAQAHFAERHAG